MLPFRERWSTQLDVRTSGQWGHFRTGSQVSRRINANVPSVWKPTPARALPHIPKPPPAAPCHVPPTAAGLQRCTIRKVWSIEGTGHRGDDYQLNGAIEVFARVRPSNHPTVCVCRPRSGRSAGRGPTPPWIPGRRLWTGSPREGRLRLQLRKTERSIVLLGTRSIGARACILGEPPGLGYRRYGHCHRRTQGRGPV